MTGAPAAAGRTRGAPDGAAPDGPAPDRQAPAAGPARPAPAERGRTVVADRAVRRIAERAAAETDLAGRRARVTHGSAAVHGRHADVSVDVGLPYPAVLGEAGERVRGRMAERVAELSGLTVRAATVRVQALSPDRTAPQPSPARESAPPGRWAAARRPWSARRIPAALVGLTAAAVCAFVLYDVLSVHLADRRSAGPRTDAVDWLATHGPGDTAVVAGGAVAAALGVWLLCLALTPGLRGVLPMAPVPGQHDQRAVLDRTAAAELVRDAASAVPGVTRVRVRCGRRRVRVRARLSFGDRPRARAALRTTTDTTLATLGLSRRLKPRVTLRPDPHWRPPGAEPAGVARESAVADCGPARKPGPDRPGDTVTPGSTRPGGAAPAGGAPEVNASAGAGPGAGPTGAESEGAEPDGGEPSVSGTVRPKPPEAGGAGGSGAGVRPAGRGEAKERET
ncbi:DUF6286 domain-containing Asp23/Gls24 family envelope stress response protein [Streptomyces salinarius]|uniref:DUF6286 domain-containing Asp23/Gls24 family envelope stress response protein n=1 Tax=Streptomyces salinarius TaxID=2762598 RepID=UPI0016473C9A|nr:DUF6286 domain-containing protein [Streptomyces salinarius]